MQNKTEDRKKDCDGQRKKEIEVKTIRKTINLRICKKEEEEKV